MRLLHKWWFAIERDENRDTVMYVSSKTLSGAVKKLYQQCDVVSIKRFGVVF